MSGQQCFMWYLWFHALHSLFFSRGCFLNFWLRRWVWWVMFHPLTVSLSELLSSFTANHLLVSCFKQSCAIARLVWLAQYTIQCFDLAKIAFVLHWVWIKLINGCFRLFDKWIFLVTNIILWGRNSMNRSSHALIHNFSCGWLGGFYSCLSSVSPNSGALNDI